MPHDQDNHYSSIRCCTRAIHNAFLPSITFSNSTPIAKPIRTSNPVQSILAFDMVADISEIVRVILRLVIGL